MTFHRLLVIAGMGLIITGCAVSSVDQSAPVSAKTVTLGAGGRPGAVPWSRSAVYGRNGMAATAHPLASQVAIDILKQGGSALDGAIAANAALGLMEPTGNGIGGDIFFIIWDPKTEQLYGYNGSGRAPLERSLIDLKSQIASLRESGAMPEDMSGIPQRGSLPVTVPGTVDGWFAAHARFGKLPMSDVLAPSCSLCPRGVSYHARDCVLL
jgi:gamma-glutamyltranspeptidase/glutathione hydrolase